MFSEFWVLIFIDDRVIMSIRKNKESLKSGQGCYFKENVLELDFGRQSVGNILFYIQEYFFFLVR